MSAHLDTLQRAMNASFFPGDAAAVVDTVGDEIVFAHRRCAGAASPSSLLMRILDELDYGLMLVTEMARVRFANRVALRECAPSAPLRLHDGHVQPRQHHEHQSFLKALAASRLGRRSMLTLRTEDSLVSLAVVPMAEAPDASGAPSTLLVFGRRQVCEPLTVEFFAREHQLTGAERAVLKGLCSGLRPAQIAAQSGVALSTVRTQICSIRQKTGARSIGELVRTVTVLPPIIPVLAS